MTKPGLSTPPDISIRKLSVSDISIVAEAFQKANWPKTPALFEQYLSKQKVGERLIWLAFVENHFV